MVLRRGDRASVLTRGKAKHEHPEAGQGAETGSLIATDISVKWETGQQVRGWEGMRYWRFKDGGEGVRKLRWSFLESNWTREMDGGCQAVQGHMGESRSRN